MSVCKRCGGEIRWFKGRDGARWVPLDHVGGHDGSLTIDANGRLRHASAPTMNGRGEYNRHVCTHKATPQAETIGVSTCVHCGTPVKRVPGGNGPTWIHEATGAVAAPGKERS